MRRRFLQLLTASMLAAATAGCVYQAPLSQGNFLDEDDLDQVETGMTRNQVRFLLGTPMINDPFNRERWDYVYYLRVGRGKAGFKRWVSIYFEADTVSRIVRDQELNPEI